MDDIITIDGVKPSSDVVDFLQQHGKPVMLSFSAGKDAVAAWLAMRDRVEVIPFFCYLVPDLEFVERGLEYYEKFFGTRIIRVPHPALYRWLNELTFQAPERRQIIEAANLPTFEFTELEQMLREDLNLPNDTYSTNGVRAADSPNRRSGFKKFNTVQPNRRKAFPVWDWRNIKLETEMLKAGVKLTEDYRMFARSFDGLDYRFLKPIKDKCPSDYARILEWFPMADIEIFRAETLS